MVSVRHVLRGCMSTHALGSTQLHEVRASDSSGVQDGGCAGGARLVTHACVLLRADRACAEAGGDHKLTSLPEPLHGMRCMQARRTRPPAARARRTSGHTEIFSFRILTGGCW